MTAQLRGQRTWLLNALNRALEGVCVCCGCACVVGVCVCVGGVGAPFV